MGNRKLVVAADDEHRKERQPVALFDLQKNISEEESGNMINNPEMADRVKIMLNANIEQRDHSVRSLSVKEDCSTMTKIDKD